MEIFLIILCIVICASVIIGLCIVICASVIIGLCFVEVCRNQRIKEWENAPCYKVFEDMIWRKEDCFMGPHVLPSSLWYSPMFPKFGESDEEMKRWCERYNNMSNLSINNPVIADIKGSVLEYLADYNQRIVSIEIIPEGFEFTEQCDNYFKEVLSLEQFDRFIKELQDLREKYATTR